MKRHLLPFAAFCAIWLFLAGLGAAMAQEPLPSLDSFVPRETRQEQTEEQPDPAFRIVGLDDRPKLRDSVRTAALAARRRIAEQTTLDWEGTALIVWTDEDTFMEKTGFAPENTAAAASAKQKTIWINERAWVQSNDRQRQQTMTHEVGHLLVGSLPGGKELPLWANEGLVMHLAGQQSYEGQMRLLAAHASGNLPLLENLETKFPGTGQSQNLAYQMSYAAVGVLARDRGDKPGEVRGLMRTLASERRGPALARELRGDFESQAWQDATHDALGSRFATALVVLTGTSSIFVLITILAVIAFVRLRMRNRRTESRWADEDEPWTESLSEEDIQDIYGDREERW